MIENNQIKKAVSPVVGVILMVAITVIIAAVVAGFVLDLTGDLSSDADAVLDYDQEITSFGDDPTYSSTVTVRDMRNSDYIVVSATNASSSVSYTVSNTGDDPSSISGVPDSAKNSSSVNSGGILVSSGDSVTVKNLKEGDTVQVFGGIGGNENIVSEYEVSENA